MALINMSFLGNWVETGRTGQIVDMISAKENPRMKTAHYQQYTRTNYTRTEVRTRTANNQDPKDLETWDLTPPQEYYSERLLAANISYSMDGIATMNKVYGWFDQYWVPVGSSVRTHQDTDLITDGQ